MKKAGAMSKNDGIVAYFLVRLEGVGTMTKAELRQTVETDQVGSTLSRDELEAVIRTLEWSFSVEQPRGASVKAEHKPWLPKRKKEDDIQFYYWERLKRYYLQRNVLPPNVVATLDSVTDEVLDYSGNPANEKAWKRRGMVMGHVQSGKTTNYAGLICKAADAGYKIIILLAGITNSLRRQTQERMEEAFIGKKSLFHKPAQEPLAITRYAEEKRFPAYGTSRDRDFSKAAASTYGVSLSALKEPIIFVTKKNKSTLESLRNWLREQNHGATIKDPLLLVDDEADNASINTSIDPNRVTAINGVMREILELFERSTYVGYTATPFANIFIDPDTEDDMIGDDLFPRHFIKALDPPSNYVGATRVFQDQGDLRDSMVINVDDFEDIIPLKHKRDLSISILPSSLYQAVRVFLIARALRILRGDGQNHCSMMVNVSRFNDVQESVYGFIYAYLEEVRNAIISNAGLGNRGLSDPIVRQMKEDFQQQYSYVEYEWSEVQKALSDAARTIVVRTVNMRGQPLDYSAYSDNGLQVIAIGGLALSRGLTLEGLTVSYVLRNASASDTLMQMARWFGYRPGYEDLCRLYLPEDSEGHYEFITEAIEELRGEVKRMQAANQTPEDFGLRVRHSPAAIRVTAPNKMKHATTLKLAQDYSGRHIEGYALRNNAETNTRNRVLVDEVLNVLKTENASSDGDAYIWYRVPARTVIRMITEFEFPEEAHPDLGPITGTKSLFTDYVNDRIEAECREWDVVLPLAKTQGDETRDFMGGNPLKIRRRRQGRVRGGIYFVTAKNKVANPGDERLGVESEQKARAEALMNANTSANTAFSRVRERPLLIIHVFTASVAEGQPALEIDNPVVSLSFCMPETAVPVSEHVYQVNPVYMRQTRESDADIDDDEALLEGESDV